MKIELYKQHELTVLLSGLDTKILALRDLDKLERFQMKSIRHIAQSQNHITKETNLHLRTRLGVPTITSKLQAARLRMYKDIFTYPTANQQVLAVLFGTVQWDRTTPTTKNQPQIQQLWNDITTLWYAKNKNTIFEHTPIPSTWSQLYVDTHMQEWLINTNRASIDKVLTFDNNRDKTRHKTTDTPAGTEQYYLSHASSVTRHLRLNMHYQHTQPAITKQETHYEHKSPQLSAQDVKNNLPI